MTPLIVTQAHLDDPNFVAVAKSLGIPLMAYESLLPIVDWEAHNTEPADDPDNWQDEAEE